MLAKKIDIAGPKDPWSMEEFKRMLILKVLEVRTLLSNFRRLS